MVSGEFHCAMVTLWAFGQSSSAKMASFFNPYFQKTEKFWHFKMKDFCSNAPILTSIFLYEKIDVLIFVWTQKVPLHSCYEWKWRTILLFCWHSLFQVAKAETGSSALQSMWTTVKWLSSMQIGWLRIWRKRLNQRFWITFPNESQTYDIYFLLKFYYV